MNKKSEQLFKSSDIYKPKPCCLFKLFKNVSSRVQIIFFCECTVYTWWAKNHFIVLRELPEM